MVEFAMPTAEELVEQLSAQRRELVAYFEQRSWDEGARGLLERADRLIARYEDQD